MLVRTTGKQTRRPLSQGEFLAAISIAIHPLRTPQWVHARNAPAMRLPRIAISFAISKFSFWKSLGEVLNLAINGWMCHIGTGRSCFSAPMFTLRTLRGSAFALLYQELLRISFSRTARA